MKPFILIKMTGVLLFTLLAVALTAQVKIGNNPGTIAPSAVLELEKANQGLLITRIALLGATDNSTIPNPANSLLIYNTAAAGTGGNAVSPGFYYWDSGSSRWKGLLTSAGPTGDVYLDNNENILSINCGNQNLSGSYNIALGNGAFGDLGGASSHVIAMGMGACAGETTNGNSYVTAIGMNSAYTNSGDFVNAFGHEAASGNSGHNLNALGEYSAYQNNANHVNALGYNAAAYNSGFEVNSLGPESCQHNTGVVVNAMGWQSAMFNGGDDINAFGVRAAQNNNDTALRVNALGLEAAQNNGGSAVNALGEGAGRNNDGSLVNLLGPAAGENNDGWSVNVLGSQAGQFNTGSELNAMGAMSGQYNTGAAVNAFGRMAARYNTGYGTNALGDEAALFNNGEHAVAIGDEALKGDTLVIEGGGNIGIGYHAGISVNTGQRNICLGYDADIPNPYANDQINIGNSIIREANGVIQLKDLIQLTPTTAPSSPVAGMIYFDSSDNKLKVFDGSTWQNCW